MRITRTNYASGVPPQVPGLDLDVRGRTGCPEECISTPSSPRYWRLVAKSNCAKGVSKGGLLRRACSPIKAKAADEGQLQGGSKRVNAEAKSVLGDVVD